MGTSAPTENNEPGANPEKRAVRDAGPYKVTATDTAGDRKGRPYKTEANTTGGGGKPPPYVGACPFSVRKAKSPYKVS